MKNNYFNPISGIKVKKSTLLWYKQLDVNQKINCKECFVLLCGIEFEKLSLIIPSFTEKIQIMHNKLKIEGFDV